MVSFILCFANLSGCYADVHLSYSMSLLLPRGCLAAERSCGVSEDSTLFDLEETFQRALLMYSRAAAQGWSDIECSALNSVVSSGFVLVANNNHNHLNSISVGIACGWF